MSFPYVLRYGGNNPQLTEVLHIWFDFLGFALPPGKPSWQSLGGKFTLETKDAVSKFQQKYRLVPPGVLGEVRANEWRQLGLAVGYKSWHPEFYECIYKGNECPSDSFAIVNFLKGVGGYGGNTLSGGIDVYGPRHSTWQEKRF